MPFLDVKIAATPSPDLAARVSATVSEITHRVLRKRIDITAVAVQFVHPADWFVAGSSLEAQGKSSFFLDVRLTDESNTREEKASYVSEVFTAFAGLLGNLHEESYVHVHDVRATAFGFGGRTVESRRGDVSQGAAHL
jgi:4-oxalocrotonate tautomerase